MMIVNISSFTKEYVEEAMTCLGNLGYNYGIASNNPDFLVVDTQDKTGEFLLRVIFFDKM